ncbi:Maf-like protein [Vibrio sp. SS-MA-C1-2]|uniref:Maf family protein n=1 Tax=Vibrio sp. SS-MA-C1-2 TaxID=2908646 RepID=UPI001F2843CE|nr:Maf family protein [Vibrio sp. SS-MA-C1-2]UJF19148.1 Maf-like protein [Vibrio sp. SS-MA-C1-2]
MTLATTELYLASGSPRRSELLTQLGVDFSVLRVDVEEQHQESETPTEYVKRLSVDKAVAGLNSLPKTNTIPVLGADTIVVIDDIILEKPQNLSDAKRMLGHLSSREHQVLTAVTIVNQQQQQTQVVTTKVWFRSLTESEIETYWESGEPQDKAGSYAIQGIGGKFVERIDGSFYAVMGLPLLETDQLLSNFKD